jgi:hypothetical protein
VTAADRGPGCQLARTPVEVLRAALVNPRQPEQLLASVGPARFLCQFAKPVRQLSIVLAGRRVVGMIGHDGRNVAHNALTLALKASSSGNRR